MQKAEVNQQLEVKKYDDNVILNTNSDKQITLPPKIDEKVVDRGNSQYSIIVLKNKPIDSFQNNNIIGRLQNKIKNKSYQFLQELSKHLQLNHKQFNEYLLKEINFSMNYILKVQITIFIVQSVLVLIIFSLLLAFSIKTEKKLSDDYDMVEDWDDDNNDFLFWNTQLLHKSYIYAISLFLTYTFIPFYQKIFLKHQNLLINVKQENHPVCYSAVPILAFLVNIVTSIWLLFSSISWFNEYSDFEDDIFDDHCVIIIISLISIVMSILVYIFVQKISLKMLEKYHFNNYVLFIITQKIEDYSQNYPDPKQYKKQYFQEDNQNKQDTERQMVTEKNQQQIQTQQKILVNSNVNSQ